MKRRLFTIGYEGATADAFLRRLKSAGVRRVVDVRALSRSRKPGFSKNALAAALAEAGIDYVHLQQLGTPPEGREAAHKGDTATMRAIYLAHLEEPEAALQLQQLAALVAEKAPAVLLCFERDPARCHRSILIEQLALPDLAVEHLYVDEP